MDTHWTQWLINSVSSELAIVESIMARTLDSSTIAPAIGVPFEISPQYHIPRTPRDPIDVVALYAVELDKRPVLFIEDKAPPSFAFVSKRNEADEQMRVHFRNLSHNLVTPRLPGISAFGTRMAFYEYVADTNTLTPRATPRLPPDPVPVDDTVAPAERWRYDLLGADGTAQMRKVAEDVKAMCQSLKRLKPTSLPPICQDGSQVLI